MPATPATQPSGNGALRGKRGGRRIAGLRESLVATPRRNYRNHTRVACADKSRQVYGDLRGRWRMTMSTTRRLAPWLIILAGACALPAPAQNIDAGKTPAQIFSDTCAGCHKNARELRRTSASYLRSH